MDCCGRKLRCTLIRLCIAVLTDEVPLVVSRQIMTAFAQDIFTLPAEVYKPVATQYVRAGSHSKSAALSARRAQVADQWAWF